MFGNPNPPGWDTAGSVAMIQNLADACENQGVLSRAMQSVAGTVVPNSDVVAMYQGVCDNYQVKSAPLCAGG